MDGTKRTAFAAALFFLENCGHPIPEQFPLNEAVALRKGHEIVEQWQRIEDLHEAFGNFGNELLPS